MLSVKEARENRICRLCGKKIQVYGVSENWEFEFRELIYPIKLTLNFGEEFCHTECLAKELNQAESI